MIGTILFLGAAYFIIGAIFDAMVDGDGLLFFFWLPIALLMVVVGAFYFPYTGIQKATKAFKTYRKNRNHIPTPTEIVQGVIQTIVLRHVDSWDGSNFKHKNISIRRTTNAPIISISGDEVPLTEELLRDINLSYHLHREKKLLEEKTKIEHRMLDNISEFMGS